MHKIIIIDDSTVVRMRIMKILQDFGYSNVFGYNSANTISSFLKTYLFDVDLIISEINLKGISGIELLEKIRNSPEFYKTPVILMSESTDEETIRVAMTAGATDFLQKPFDDETILEKVKSVVTKPLASQYQQILEREVGKLQAIITSEYERALRGSSYVSFIKFITDTGNLNENTKKIKKILRKIDIVENVAEDIFIVLPLTNEAGLEIVIEKLQFRLKKFGINMEKIETETFYPDTTKNIEALLTKFLGSYPV